MADTYSLLFEIDDSLATPSSFGSLYILTSDNVDDLCIDGTELRALIFEAVHRRIAEIEDRLS